MYVKVTTPSEAQHYSGLSVKLFTKESTGKILRQYFYETPCESDEPMINTYPKAKCKTVKSMHKALFFIDELQYKNRKLKYKKLCRRYENTKKFLCDDWIYLQGSCALFVEG